MFGHDHKDENKDDPAGIQPLNNQPVNSGLLGIDDDDTSSSSAPVDEPSAPPVTTSDADDTFSSAPPASTSDSSSLSSDSSASSTDESTPSTETTLETPSADPSASPADSDLMSIKREALEELSPLIDHLDQGSEEKFRTTMMMIQASDNQGLIPQAFKAAKEISDDKKRAQALLDIVNEINYFTHKTGE